MSQELTKQQEEAVKRANEAEKELKEYKESLHDVKDLDAEEQKWIDQLNEFDAYIKGRTYNLPAKVMYDNTEYTRREIGTFIRTFFQEKLELEWKFIPAMLEMCKFWSAPAETISYGYLDSTLRILDQFKYKGNTEWTKISAVNEYFRGATDEYHEDVEKLIKLSKMHNAVLDERQLREPVQGADEPEHRQSSKDQ